jgi:hypothetical protein
VPEQNQISRWGWAIQHALNQNPSPAPDKLLAFIAQQGGRCGMPEEGASSRGGGRARRSEAIPSPLRTT